MHEWIIFIRVGDYCRAVGGDHHHGRHYHLVLCCDAMSGGGGGNSSGLKRSLRSASPLMT